MSRSRRSFRRSPTMSWKRSSRRRPRPGRAGGFYLPVRLPHEVAPLFRAWLDEHYPDRAAKVMATIQLDARRHATMTPISSRRMRGQGPWAELLAHPLRDRRASATACARPSSRCAATCSSRRRATRCGCFDRYSTNGGDRRRSTRLATRAMIRFALAACFARSPPPRCSPSPPPRRRRRSPVDPMVAALRDAALDDDHYAWDITEGLTTEVGQRLAGTEAEARARDWAVAKLKAMGFANVRVEPFDMPVWARGLESAEILAPFPQKMVVAALGNSASTGPAGVTGEIVALRQRRCAARRARRRGARQDRVRRPSHAADPGRLGLRPVRRAAPPGPDHRQPEGRARRSSSARSAPTITAIRTPACMSFADGATPIPAGALSRPRRRADACAS